MSTFNLPSCLSLASGPTFPASHFPFYPLKSPVPFHLPTLTYINRSLPLVCDRVCHLKCYSFPHHHLRCSQVAANLAVSSAKHLVELRRRLPSESFEAATSLGPARHATLGAIKKASPRHQTQHEHVMRRPCAIKANRNLRADRPSTMAARSSQDLEQLDRGVVVFRYTDLPAELQQMILEDAIVEVTQGGGEKLSRLAVVSREWQKRVEEITFASLGKDPGTNIASPFRAIHPCTFEHVVTGTRRASLRSIVLDFDFDEEGTPELQGSHPVSLEDQATRIHATRVRRCHRFTDYIRKLFRVLHAWDATRVGRPHLRLKIRVYGTQLDHMMVNQYDETPLREDLTGLPPVGSIRSFELINPDYQKPDNCYYIRPGSIDEIINRLPQLVSATIHTSTPDVLERYDEFDMLPDAHEMFVCLQHWEATQWLAQDEIS